MGDYKSYLSCGIISTLLSFSTVKSPSVLRVVKIRWKLQSILKSVRKKGKNCYFFPSFLRNQACSIVSVPSSSFRSCPLWAPELNTGFGDTVCFLTTAEAARKRTVVPAEGEQSLLNQPASLRLFLHFLTPIISNLRGQAQAQGYTRCHLSRHPDET